MRGYWYIEGDDGRHYCYSKEPTYECPVGGMRSLGDILELAAGEVGIDPKFMLRRLQHSAGRARVEGRLTDVCLGCGHKLDRLGFRYWIEGEPTEDEDTSSSRIAARLGLGDGFVTVEGPWYAKTKKDAQAWARQRVAATKAAA